MISRRRRRLALAGALLAAACSCGPEAIHVRSIGLEEGTVPPSLREVGLDDAAVEGATREALRAAGFRIGDGARPHRALVSVTSVRFLSDAAGGGPRAEVAVEIALGPAEPRSSPPRREVATASILLAGAASQREAWAGALAQAARRASDAHALAFAAEAKPEQKLLADVDDEDPRVCEHAVRVLGERRSRAAVPALVARLRREDSRLAHRIIAALAQIGDERAVPALIEISQGGDAAVAGRLVRYIGDIGGAEAQGYLLTLASGHPDQRIRAAAREALDELSARAKEAVAARK